MKIARGLIFVSAAAITFGSALEAHAMPEIAWAPHAYELNSGVTIEAEIGSMDVPAHRGRGAAETTLGLRFVRIPAAGSNAGPPIIYLAGGPGSSGIEAGRGDRWALMDALRQEGDVILLDQRGAGLSSAPPPCSTPWRFPSNEASTEASFNASLEAAAAVCAAEWRAAGIDLSAFNTAENAADVADLARALGGRVRLIGISYGTFLALAVLRDHHDLIDSVVLAGIEGPDHTLKLPLQADAALEALARRVAADPTAAALTPDLRASVVRVLDRLEQAPAWAEVRGRDGAVTRVLVSKYDVQTVTAFLLATTPNAARLPALYAAMEQGDFSGIGQMVLLLRRFLAPLPPMALAMDAASPVSRDRHRIVMAQTRQSLFENAINFPSADFASALGVRVLPRRWHRRLGTSVPAYLISGDLDSRTPPANAEDVRRGFRSSAHLVLEGAGHDNDLFLSSPQILERIRGFLRGESVHDETIAVDVLRFQ